MTHFPFAKSQAILQIRRLRLAAFCVLFLAIVIASPLSVFTVSAAAQVTITNQEYMRNNGFQFGVGAWGYGDSAQWSETADA